MQAKGYHDHDKPESKTPSELRKATAYKRKFAEKRRQKAGRPAAAAATRHTAAQGETYDQQLLRQQQEQLLRQQQQHQEEQLESLNAAMRMSDPVSGDYKCLGSKYLHMYMFIFCICV